MNAAPAGTHQFFLYYALGATVFAGAGDYADATRNALNQQKQWYGYPAGTAHVARSTVTKASFPALATYNGSANQLVLRVGCYNRGTPCALTAGNGIGHSLFGADVTVNDPTPPDVAVEASGLLAGGERSGSDPVTLSATDGAGIRQVDLIDVTNPAAPAVVGSEDYTTQRTEANRLCDYSLPAPCPQLSGETVRPTRLTAGVHQLVVRVTDTGGNITDRGPYPLFARTPSDRGAPNGTNVTDTATMNVVFTNTSKPRQTASYGKHVKIRGRLRQRVPRPDRQRARGVAHARPAARRHGRAAPGADHEARRQLQRHGGGDRLAAGPVRLARLRQRRAATARTAT